MKIALSLGLNVEFKRGLDYYFQGLSEGLARVDARNEYSLFSYFYTDFEAKRRELPLPSGPNFKQAAKKWPSSVVNRLESAGVPVIDRLFVRPGSFDLFHSLDGRPLPRASRVKTVTTIHDLMPEVFYQQALKEGRRPEVYPTGAAGLSARRADRVIATSTGTRDDLARIYGIDPAKVTVILYGANEALFHPSDEARLSEVRGRYGLTDPFVLFMGPFQSRHNAERVLDAVARLRGSGIGRGLRLVFVGKPNAYLEGIEARALRLGLGGDVRRLGYLPLADLPPLYQLALAVAHPTTYGGGLPVYESIACGAALITSKTPESTMPEIVQDGALLVDPFSVDEIAGALKLLLADDEAGRRLRERALARGRRLTWSRTAQETLAVYRQLAAGGE